MLNKKYL